LACVASLATASATGAQEGIDTLPDKVVGYSLGPIAQQQRTAGVENRRIRSTGANTVSLSVWWEFDPETSTVRPGQMTNPDGEVRVAVQSVRASGLSAAILPMLMCTRCETNWRGAIKPSNKTLFYRSYRGMIRNYAEIAQDEGASLLFIGSEMSSTQGDTEEWREIAATARSEYSGAIAYDVNWDAIDGVKFWEAVDIPSISAYFPLSPKRHPTLDTLKKAWYSSQVEHWYERNSVAEVQKLAQKTGKRVLFGEAGYRSVDFGTKLPFDFAAEGDANPALQADAYQALIETFDDKPYWRGVLWWEWELNTARPERETGFTPRGKAAEDVVRAWYAEGIRPSEEAPRLADRSSQTGGSNAPTGEDTTGRTGGGRTPTAPPKTPTGSPGQPPANAPVASPGADGAAGPAAQPNGEVAAPAPQDNVSSSVPARTVAAVVAGALILLVLIGAMARRDA
jgi:hypothetical protein